MRGLAAAACPGKATLLGMAAAVLFCCVGSAKSAFVVEPIHDRVVNPGAEFPGVPIEDISPSVAEPFKEIAFLNGDDPMGRIIARNDTGLQITGLHWFIPPTGDKRIPPGFVQPDVTWGDVSNNGKVGESDIFSEITVSPDHKSLSFTGGTIHQNEYFTDFKIPFPMPEGFWTVVSFSVVPEPGSLSLLTLGLIALLGFVRHSASSHAHTISSSSDSGHGGYSLIEPKS